MAFAVTNDRETPVATLVVEYTFGRIGKHPAIRMVYGEVVHLTEKETVSAEADADADGLYEVLTLPAWADRHELVGETLYDAAGTALATITHVSMDQFTLSAGLPAGNVGKDVQVRVYTPTGAPAYRMARGGRRWELRFNTNSTEAWDAVKRLMGHAYFNALRQALDKVGRTDVTDTELQDAINGLALEAKNIEGYIAEQAEILEQERQAGQHAWLVPLGDAPLT